MKERGQRGESGTKGHLLWGFLPSLEQARLEALPTQKSISARLCVCVMGVFIFGGGRTAMRDAAGAPGRQ